MIIDNDLTDETVLEELGRRLAKQRLDLSLTQGDLAMRAGLGKRTIERIEAGEPAQVGSLVRMLRALNMLDRLNSLLPDESVPRPMELLKLKGKERQRASSPHKLKKEKTEPTKAWTWGEDK